MDFNHTAAQAGAHHQALLDKFSQVIESGIFLHGSQASQLEKSLADFYQVPQVTTVSSGHDAILLSLQHLQLQPMDEVIFQVNAYPTAFPVAMAGVTPIPVDVTTDAQMSYESLVKHTSPRTKAIIITHMYGMIGDLQPLFAFAKKKKIPIIEDSAHAFGTLWKKRLVGTLGIAGCLSFYPTKNFGTLGDGGAIISTNPDMHTYLGQAKAYGESERYRSSFVAGHSRLSEIQAAALNVYWESFAEIMAARRQVHRWYQDAFANSKLDEGKQVRLLQSGPKSKPVLHILAVSAQNRDKLQKFLAKRDIPTLIHYPHPVYAVPAFAQYEWSEADFPIANQLSRTILSLPFHQYLTQNEVAYVVETLAAFYRV